VDYLGLIIGHGQVQMDPVKTNAITDWLIPTNKMELPRFIGFLNFYRRFVESFSQITSPLHQLTSKVKWEWTTEQQNTFDRLKTIITTDPILVLPVPDKKFTIECDACDASDYVIGAILSQEQPDGLF
jgi:hypothetical protein